MRIMFLFQNTVLIFFFACQMKVSDESAALQRRAKKKFRLPANFSTCSRTLSDSSQSQVNTAISEERGLR